MTKTHHSVREPSIQATADVQGSGFRVQGSGQRFARNAEQLARAFGLNLSPRKRKKSIETVNGWIAAAGFPKKTRKGWVISEVAEWLKTAEIRNPKSEIRNHQDSLPKQTGAGGQPEFISLTPEEAEAAYRRKLEDNRRIYLGLKFTEFPLRKFEVDELIAHKLIPKITMEDAPPAAQSGDGSDPLITIPDRITRQSDLAGFLHGYFRAKITITINAQTIDDWRSGQRLKPVMIDGRYVKPPPFPNKEKSGIGWDPHECIEWVERWIVPVHKAGAGQSDLSGVAAVDFDSAKREHELWKMKRERDISDGAYKPTEIFNRHIATIGTEINGYINEHCARTLQRTLEMAIEALPLTGDAKWPFLQAISTATRQAADNIRAGLKKSLESHIEPVAPVEQQN